MRRDRGPLNKMGILTYQACWDQQRQRRGPCPGEPLKENRAHLRDWKFSQIQWGEETFRPQSNRLNRDARLQSSPHEKRGKQSPSSTTTCSPSCSLLAPALRLHAVYHYTSLFSPYLWVLPLSIKVCRKSSLMAVVWANSCPHMASS